MVNAQRALRPPPARAREEAEAARLRGSKGFGMNALSNPHSKMKLIDMAYGGNIFSARWRLPGGENADHAIIAAARQYSNAPVSVLRPAALGLDEKWPMTGISWPLEMTGPALGGHRGNAHGGARHLARIGAVFCAHVRQLIAARCFTALQAHLRGIVKCAIWPSAAARCPSAGWGMLAAGKERNLSWGPAEEARRSARFA